ncbi:hypothetical protein LX32DRAFT_680045 [Colletotrichum zoysiae]|uniref:Uncharacterized protein n=1 Tax=Colletotrichum zoysiae TaxID=1216348 RepID=A0AAD9HQ76_9PEZI|nr:hypothetical protein LX32DRAFT_680045 [Colletotrichum zoysiae]
MENHSASAAVTKSPKATAAQGVSQEPPTDDDLPSTLYAPSTSAPQLPPTVHLIHGKLGRQEVYTVMSPDYDTPCIVLVDKHRYSSSFTMKMLNGESHTAGVLATARGKVGPFFSHNFLEVTLPSRVPTETEGTKITMKCRKPSFRRCDLDFDLTLDGNEDCLEWKKTTDAEAKALGEGLRRKLVRKSRPKSGTDDLNMLPEPGFESDEEEIVAFMADKSGWNPGRSLALHFEGSVLEDALGQNWKSFALLSGLWLWWIDLRGYGKLTAGSAVISTAGIALIAGIAF